MVRRVFRARRWLKVTLFLSFTSVVVYMINTLDSGGGHSELRRDLRVRHMDAVDVGAVERLGKAKGIPGNANVGLENTNEGLGNTNGVIGNATGLARPVDDPEFVQGKTNSTTTTITTTAATTTTTTTTTTIKPTIPINETLLDRVNRILSEITFSSDSDLLPKCYQPATNFVYIKNHKCGSDTMAAVFRRFGYVRNLTFVQPPWLWWNIGWPFKLEPHMYRPSKTGPFNILTEHTVYDEETIGKIMPANAKYMTSLREPFGRLKSVVRYFVVGEFSGVNKSESNKAGGFLEYFLKSDNKTAIDEGYKRPNDRKVCVPPGFSVMRNAMSFELGLPVGFHTKEDRQDDVDYLKEWLQRVDSKFTMVILLEYFTESLVMLKRLMCWSAKDVLFRRLNQKRDDENVKPDYFGDPKIESFLSWSLADTLIYVHFNRTLWRRIELMGTEDFNAELQDFKRLHKQTMTYCANVNNATWLGNDHPNDDGDGDSVRLMRVVKNSDKNTTTTWFSRPPLIFKQTKWNPDIVITKQDCDMLFSKLDMRQELRDRYDNNPAPVEPQPTPPDGKPHYGC